MRPDSGGEGQIVYEYVAYSQSGEVVKGRLTAESEEAAGHLLDYAGYQVVNLKTFVPFLSLDKLLFRFSRVKSTEVILFYRQLALLLDSGMDIVTSLELLRGQASSRILRKVLGTVIADLRSGDQLSTALGKHPRVFPPISQRSLRVGEQAGGLETMLRQVADYMEKEAAAAKGIKGALMYPVITAIMTVIVVAVLATFVFPAFGQLYGSLGVELPLPARILMGTSSLLQSHGMYLVLAVLLIAAGAYLYVRTPKGRYRWDRLVLNLPLIGQVVHRKELARCCRSIALLFRAGLPLTEIMPLVIQDVGNKVMIDALADVQQAMLKGEGLAQPMAKSNLFLPMMVQMVKVGEETGNLDNTLLAVAEGYEAEAKDRTDSLIGLIQPALTVFISLVIGLIALAMVSAMYSIYGEVM